MRTARLLTVSQHAMIEGVYLPGGIPACGGCICPGTPPCEQNDRQVQKYYLAPNFVCGRYKYSIDNTSFYRMFCATWKPITTRMLTVCGRCHVGEGGGVVRYSPHTPWTDTHLWKHYLPATSFAGGNYSKETDRNASIDSDDIRIFNWNSTQIQRKTNKCSWKSPFMPNHYNEFPKFLLNLYIKIFILIGIKYDFRSICPHQGIQYQYNKKGMKIGIIIFLMIHLGKNAGELPMFVFHFWEDAKVKWLEPNNQDSCFVIH